jgi:hypothetical protein
VYNNKRLATQRCFTKQSVVLVSMRIGCDDVFPLEALSAFCLADMRATGGGQYYYYLGRSAVGEENHGGRGMEA